MPCSFQLEDLHELTDENFIQLSIRNDTRRGWFKYCIDHYENMAKSSMLRFLIIPLTILFMAPMISANSNNLFFESTYDSGIQNQGFMSIELNQDGTLAYASFGKTLIQYSPTNQDTIQSKLFEQEILSIALSPDGSRLALTIRDSGTASDTFYVIDTDTFNTKISSQATASNAVLLSWTNNLSLIHI